jgi:hypothetical protein
VDDPHREGPADPSQPLRTPAARAGCRPLRRRLAQQRRVDLVVADAVERIAAGTSRRSCSPATSRPAPRSRSTSGGRCGASPPTTPSAAPSPSTGCSGATRRSTSGSSAASRPAACWPGTIRRSGDRARDVEQAGSLARSSKDLEEHEYAVRSVAEALRPHCDTVDVPDEPFVLHLANVMHLATDVRATVADGASSLALVASLHPSAAVCGTPTARPRR